MCAIADIWRISDGMLFLQETIYICFQKKNYCLGGGGVGEKELIFLWFISLNPLIDEPVKVFTKHRSQESSYALFYDGG